MSDYRPVWLLEPQPDPQSDGGEGPTLVVGAMTDQDILVADAHAELEAYESVPLHRGRP
jgi:hypothetical protein